MLDIKLNSGIDGIIINDNVQRYDVYLNNGTPRENGKWVKVSSYIKNIAASRKLDKLCVDYQEQNNNLLDELKHSYKVNASLSWLSLLLGLAIIYKEDLIILYKGLFL